MNLSKSSLVHQERIEEDPLETTREERLAQLVRFVATDLLDPERREYDAEAGKRLAPEWATWLTEAQATLAPEENL